MSLERTVQEPPPIEIGRAGEHDVKVRWRDGTVHLLPAQDLRADCWCAACVSEATGDRTLRPENLPEDVHPVGIKSVGNYAVQIEFSDGHGTGIYTWSHLRELGHRVGGSQTKERRESVGSTLVSNISSLGRKDREETRNPKSIPIELGGRAPAEPKPQAAAKENGDALTGQSTMGEIVRRYPSSQRTLFQKFHVGGCSSCGYRPEDTLQEVLASHGHTNVEEAVRFILDGADQEKKLQISPAEAARLLKQDPKAKLLDVRDEYESSLASIQEAQLLSRELASDMMSSWPKDSTVVFFCHTGARSMDAAAYFAGHGFTNVKSMAGGIDAWSQEVDPSVPRY
ncbi:MAG: DUF971 domain-containing protein [Nitrospirae bacterium]|nr:DUF971 domain-containing protein [Nitrospirota bacterium]